MSASLQLDRAARQIDSELDQARLRAIRTRRSVRWIAPAGARGTRLEEERAGAWETVGGGNLPGGLRVASTTAPDGTIRFTARGTAATFGSITLANDNGDTLRIVVNIAGRSRIAR